MALRYVKGMKNAMREQGTSLIEALVASLIMTTGVATMAQLFSLSIASNAAARRSTIATVLAEQKIEQLRVEAAVAGSAFPASPPSSLDQSTDGFVDHLGVDGRVVSTSTQPPAQAIYTRRWSVEPITADPDAPVVIQVIVAQRAGLRRASRTRGDFRVATLATRSAP